MSSGDAAVTAPAGSPARDPALAAALAAFFVGIQFYTSLAALSPTPPVGYVFLGFRGAAVLVAVLIVAALVAALRLRRHGGAPTTASRRLLAWWIGAALVASLFGVDPAHSLQTVGIAVVACAFHLALVRWYGSPPVAAVLLTAYLGAGALASAASVVMVLTRRPAALYALNHGRAAGPFVTTNQLGAYLVLDLFLAAGVALATRRRGLRLLAATNVALAVVALALSFSRGAWLGAAVAACFYAAVLGARRTALGLGAALLLGAALVTLRPVAGHNPAEALTRLTTLEGGARAAELFPLTGSGPMTYFELFPAIRPSNGGPPGSFEALHPHDLVLSLLGELGLGGTLAVAAGWIVFVREVRARLRGAVPANRRLALGVCAGFVGLFVQGVADLVGIVEIVFVWIPYAALGLAAARSGLAE